MDETSDSSMSARDYQSSDSEWDNHCGLGMAVVTASSHHGYPLKYRQVELLCERPAQAGPPVWAADNTSFSRDTNYRRTHMNPVFAGTKPDDDVVGELIGDLWSQVQNCGLCECDVDRPTLVEVQELEAIEASDEASGET